jgi:hypothetical protein
VEYAGEGAGEFVNERGEGSFISESGEPYEANDWGGDG